MATKIRDGEVILFYGDSITDAGRTENSPPLGEGYVRLLHALLAIREPRKQVRFINEGHGGNTTRHLRDRFPDAVQKHSFDRFVLLVGINDLHSYIQGGLPWDPTIVSPDVYETNLEYMLSRVARKIPQGSIILGDPFYLSTDTTPGTQSARVLAALPAYHEVMRKMAARYGARHVRTHHLFRKFLKHQPAAMICSEPVHPNVYGHLLIAEAMYRALSRKESD